MGASPPDQDTVQAQPSAGSAEQDSLLGRMLSKVVHHEGLEARVLGLEIEAWRRAVREQAAIVAGRVVGIEHAAIAANPQLIGIIRRENDGVNVRVNRSTDVVQTACEVDRTTVDRYV